jgi:hypothetical protein
MRNQTSLVIPAEAGIHGRNCRVTQRSLFELWPQAMDSRLRGNDTVFVCKVG